MKDPVRGTRLFVLALAVLTLCSVAYFMGVLNGIAVAIPLPDDDEPDEPPA